MSKRTLGIFAAVMVFAGLVALQVASSAKSRKLQSVMLPDGMKLHLLRIGYGKEHPFPGAWWLPLALRLPLAWQMRLNVMDAEDLHADEPSLGVWFSREVTEFTGGDNWDIAFVNELGEEVPATPTRHTNHAHGLAPGVKGYAFTAFPRRSATMTLRIYDKSSAGGPEPIASFVLTNPVSGKYPEWRPQPLPASIKRGDVEVVFQRLLVGVSTGGNRPRPGETAWARADVELRVNGAPTYDWYPDDIELEDATGNRLRRGSGLGGLRFGGRYELHCHPYLWTGETAWKTRIHLMRSELAVFNPNELVVVTGLAIPAADAVTELNLRTNRLGHEVRVFGLAQGNGKFGGQRSGMVEEGLRIVLQASPELGAGKRLTVLSVRDDQGRKVQNSGRGRSNSSYSFSYEPKPDAKTLDFTLAVQEVVTAEFLVKPELFKPAPAAAK